MYKKTIIVSLITAVLAFGVCLVTALAANLAAADHAPDHRLPFYNEASGAPKDAVYFEATVLELCGEQLLVQVHEGFDQIAFDRVLVNTVLADGQKQKGICVGDEIGIAFDGKVAMSLPAQILTVYGFYCTEK